MYFTQLIGIALGIPNKKLGIGKEFIAMAPSLSAIGQE
jgi:heterodisulfide reductase subunit B